MIEDPDYLADHRFFDLVDLGGLPPQGSLEAASGLKSNPGPYATGLIERGETAWRTPFRELSCESVRTLVEQKFGLQWLGRPAIAFASAYPGAAITNYPGEMGLLCLRAADELAEWAQPDFARWLASDFGWMDEVFGWSRALLKEAGEALAHARTL